jgi:hypothetical protein
MSSDDSPTGVEYSNAETATPETASQMAPPNAEFKTIAALLDAGPAYVTNFTGTPRDTWAFLAKVQGGDSKKMGENLGDSIDVRYWFAHYVEMEHSKTGELIKCIRVAVVDGGGQVHTAVSEGIVYGLDQIRQVFGDGPYNGDIVCKVKQVATRSGNRTYNLVPV